MSKTSRNGKSSATPMVVPTEQVALTAEERQARGRDLRNMVPRSSHADWNPPAERPNPVDLLQSQAQNRISELIPIRYGRMVESPFTFLRGAAVVMAQDLANTPSTGLMVQLCGDCHLSNFGFYASPERNLVFDINDFDETLPGPWEWDLKRLAASFSVAARTLGMRPADCHDIVLRLVETYRTQMQTFAQMTMLKVWYAYLSTADLLARMNPKQQQRANESIFAKVQTQDHLRALSKLTTVQDGRRQFTADPPFVVPIESSDLQQEIQTDLQAYRESLQSDRQHLLDAYRITDLAYKMVGIGSVGTRCYIGVFEGRDPDDALLLQFKEAGESVLEAHLPKSTYRHSGQRVVAGQRLMQAASDIFLGWMKGPRSKKDFYVRQLRDMKYAVPLAALRLSGWLVYAQICGWTLARAHARSGDRIQIAGYLGNSQRFDEAIAAFAQAYAEQTARDHAAFQEAIASGRIKAQTE